MTRPRRWTTQEAAAELGIPASLIRSWHHRGRVVPAGLAPGPGRHRRVPLWSLDDLAPLAAAYLARHARTRPETGQQAGPDPT